LSKGFRPVAGGTKVYGVCVGGSRDLSLDSGGSQGFRRWMIDVLYIVGVAQGIEFRQVTIVSLLIL
jgi:hypothetical protein